MAGRAWVARPRGRPAAWAAARRAGRRRSRWARAGSGRRGRRPTTMAGPGAASKTSRTGSSRLPMPSGWISQAAGPRRWSGRPRACGRRGSSAAGAEVVGVVLHERGAAGADRADRLDRAQHDRGLPVAFAAEAVAVGHQPLHGQARQLPQSAEVLEVRGERAEAAGGEEARRPTRSGAVAQRVVPITAGPQLRRDIVGVLILLDQLVELGLGDGVDLATRSLTPYVLTETPNRVRPRPCRPRSRRRRACCRRSGPA